MDINQLIAEIEDLLDDASQVPFSKKVMLDKEEAEDLLNQIRDSFPQEMKQAEWITSEKDRILADAHKEAEQIIAEAQQRSDEIHQDAEHRYEELVNTSEVVVTANHRADEIIARAEQNARLLKSQSITYIDEMLATTQDRLKELLDVLEENRGELRSE